MHRTTASLVTIVIRWPAPQPQTSMSKSSAVLIRLEPQDRHRMEKAAKAEYLDLSAWARRILLRELDALDQEAKKGKGGK